MAAEPNFDADPRNADWIKTQHWEFSTDVQTFLWQIGGEDKLAHFLTLPAAESMPEMLRLELAVKTGRLVPMKYAKDFEEALHPRDDHGRFTDSGGGGGDSASGTATTTTGERVALPTSKDEIHALYLKDFTDFTQERIDHGGPPPVPSTGEEVYKTMNVADGTQHDIPPDQLARCEEAAAKFLSDPEMQPLFDEYGKPGICVATGMVTAGAKYNPDGPPPGADPGDANVVAQWSNGTMILYADTAGNPNTPVTPGFSTAGADPYMSLIHEYGHQIMGVNGYNSSGDVSEFRTSFIEAMGGGIPLDDNMSAQQREDFQANVDVNASQVSEYATSSPDEAFAEFFAALQEAGPNFDIESQFDGGAAEAMHLIRDKIKADTGTTI